MIESSSKTGAAKTSMVQHPSLSDVVLYEAERAIAETSLTEWDMAGALLRAYEDQVAEHARTLDVVAPRESMSLAEYSKRDSSANTRIRRYRSGAQAIPADMIEPWLSVLPPEYSERARQTIARRLGFIGAERPDVDRVATEQGLLPGICKESGDVIATIGRALADGRLDEKDAAQAPAMLKELDDLIAAAVSARECVIARTGGDDQQIRIVRGATA